MDEENVDHARAFVAGSITVRGEISIDTGTTLAVFRNRTVRGGIYIVQVLRAVIPEVERIGENFILVDDNVPAHRAKIVNAFNEEHGINRNVWPANSPDGNLIENGWTVSKKRIRHRHPQRERSINLKLQREEDGSEFHRSRSSRQCRV